MSSWGVNYPFTAYIQLVIGNLSINSKITFRVSYSKSYFEDLVKSEGSEKNFYTQFQGVVDPR